MASRIQEGGGGMGSLGSPASRAALAVAKNKKMLAEKTLKDKNTAIKKKVTKK